jgi:haloacetate dehalogenase
MYPDALDQKHLRVEETDYLFVIGGAGPPLLLLHGFPQTHLCWDLVAPALAENRTVIAPDLRGYGGSTAPMGGPRGVTDKHRAAYVEAMTPRTIHAICADYCASFFLDRDHDVADCANGRRISAPTLVVTGTEETQLDDAPAIWRSWAAQVSAERVPGGHFLPEEAPDALLLLLAQFLGGRSPKLGAVNTSGMSG